MTNIIGCTYVLQVMKLFRCVYLAYVLHIIAQKKRLIIMGGIKTNTVGEAMHDEKKCRSGGKDIDLADC